MNEIDNHLEMDYEDKVGAIVECWMCGQELPDELDATEHDCGAHCPVCAELMDYCQGHGEIGDPVGFGILEMHNNGDHSKCAYDGAYCKVG